MKLRGKIKTYNTQLHINQRTKINSHDSGALTCIIIIHIYKQIERGGTNNWNKVLPLCLAGFTA